MVDPDNYHLTSRDPDKFPEAPAWVGLVYLALIVILYVITEAW